LVGEKRSSSLDSFREALLKEVKRRKNENGLAEEEIE
jgi:hypothetical protein